MDRIFGEGVGNRRLRSVVSWNLPNLVDRQAQKGKCPHSATY